MELQFTTFGSALTLWPHTSKHLAEGMGGGVACLYSGPWQLKCLIHDGQGPSGFHSNLLIPSHQHEMLIVRQSGSRTLRLVRSSQALICAWASEGLGFVTIHLWFLSSSTSESTLLGCHCVLYLWDKPMTLLHVHRHCLHMLQEAEHSRHTFKDTTKCPPPPNSWLEKQQT